MLFILFQLRLITKRFITIKRKFPKERMFIIINIYDQTELSWYILLHFTILQLGILFCVEMRLHLLKYRLGRNL